MLGPGRRVQGAGFRGKGSGFKLVLLEFCSGLGEGIFVQKMRAESE